MKRGSGRWRRTLGAVLAAVAALATASAIFFGYYGLRVAHYVLAYRGEGSLGHVGAWIAAGLFPLLAVLGLGVACAAGKAARRRLEG